MLLIQPPGLKFVPRSTISGYDFTAGDFTRDGAWHELNLSALIASNAKGVGIHCDVINSGGNRVLAFAPHGLGSAYFRWGDRAMTASETWTMSFPFVPIIGGPSIDYFFQDSSFGTVNLSILGWWQ